MARQHIDRDKLRAAIRRANECIFHMLDIAIELIPQAKLRKLIEGCLNPAEIYANSERKPELLLAAVQAFHKAGLAGKYYQPFAVNSKNFMDISNGTLAWMADCHRLLDQCIAQAQRKEDPAIVCRAFEIIFSLLDQIDAGNDGILFFADEGGSSVLGIDRERCCRPGSGFFPRRPISASTRNELTRS